MEEEFDSVMALLGWLAATLISVVGLQTMTTSGCLGRNDEDSIHKRALNKTFRGELVIGRELEGGEAAEGRGFIGTAYKATMKSTKGGKQVVVAKEFYPKALDDIDFTNQHWTDYRIKVMKLEYAGLARIHEIYWPLKPNRPAPVVVYEMVGKQQTINVYLRKAKDNKMTVPLDFKYGVLAQVAAAINHLHSERIGNPYIGGRNVIIDEVGNGEVALNIPPHQRKGNLPMVKVTDYALGWVLKRRLKTQFLDSTFPELPIRWMALETINENKFNKQTDVFAFGMLCWEVMNDGKRPFGQMLTTRIIRAVIEYKGSVPPDALNLDCNKNMKELIYRRCFVYVEVASRPIMSTLSKTLVDFYLGDYKIPPLEEKEESETTPLKKEPTEEIGPKSNAASAFATTTTAGQQQATVADNLNDPLIRLAGQQPDENPFSMAISRAQPSPVS